MTMKKLPKLAIAAMAATIMTTSSAHAIIIGTNYMCQNTYSGEWQNCEVTQENMDATNCLPMVADDNGGAADEWDCNLVVDGEVRGVEDTLKKDEIFQKFQEDLQSKADAKDALDSLSPDGNLKTGDPALDSIR